MKNKTEMMFEDGDKAKQHLYYQVPSLTPNDISIADRYLHLTNSISANEHHLYQGRQDGR